MNGTGGNDIRLNSVDVLVVGSGPGGTRGEGVGAHVIRQGFPRS